MSIRWMVRKDVERTVAGERAGDGGTGRVVRGLAEQLAPDGLDTLSMAVDSPGGPGAPDRTGGKAAPEVTSALEVLSGYFATEIVALYIFILSILGIVQKEFPALPWWWVAFGLCLALVWLLSDLGWRAERRALAEADRARAAYPGKPIAAGVISFAVWAAAIPGNPVLSTDGLKALAGVVAITVSLVLPLIVPIPKKPAR